MTPKIVQGVGAHNLGYGTVGDVAVFGSTLVGQVNVRAGATLLGTLAVGATVGTRIVLNSELHRAAPLVIEMMNAADRVNVLCAGVR